VFRVVNLVTALVLVAAGFLLASVTMPAVLASLAALGALYEESVTFDQTRNRVEFRLGLVILHRTKVFALDQVAEVRTAVFGSAKFTGLELGLKDGKVLTIENDRGKPGSERLTAWGADLATWLGVPLVT
jgi:hypothetical protein